MNNVTEVGHVLNGYSEEELRQLLFCLVKLDEDDGWQGSGYGLCASIDDVEREHFEYDLVPYSLVQTVWSAWPDHSGDATYPVPPPSEPDDRFLESGLDLTAENYYEFCCDGAISHWEGEYGEARIRMLKFGIEYLRAYLKERCGE